MLIKGLQKLTLLDFPDKMACTVFTFGCNFRCPFCHNASLVLADRATEDVMPEEEFFDFLSRRKGILEGVCVTGGEPTLQPDLPAFLARIKAMGYAVKLDTNGYRPSVLKALVEAGLVDYVAMDVKNSIARYGETVGIARFDPSPIEESMDYLMAGHVPFEFRTTLVSGLHTPDDIRAIGERLAGQERFFLQTFKDSGDLISDGLSGFAPAETVDMLAILRAYVPNAQIRGE
ncbi:MAG: anaerobic ribonucleoside-triphosphate reductase activating protein [Clostridia bacterium]|nr:anaerobic ribonucleoside-triphosphate reductase activating protein [Clostridia bacterium]